MNFAIIGKVSATLIFSFGGLVCSGMFATGMAKGICENDWHPVLIGVFWAMQFFSAFYVYLVWSKP